MHKIHKIDAKIGWTLFDEERRDNNDVNTEHAILNIQGLAVRLGVEVLSSEMEHTYVVFIDYLERCTEE